MVIGRLIGMDLLTNAITSIQVGVEDYNQASAERMLSAVRNIHSGVLLMYKEALRRRSPPGSDDVLVKAQMVPSIGASGDLTFVGKGKKTVDVQQIKERFAGLGINTDWSNLDKITEARNNLEHYVPKHSSAALEGLVAAAFAIVRDFLAKELKEDPLRILGEETWQAMLGVSEVYEQERQACEASCDGVDWQSEALSIGVGALSCSECGADLMRPTDTGGEIGLECSRCGVSEDRDSYVPRAILAALEGPSYSSMKDGGEDLYITCPECGEETYVIEERQCALCHAQVDHTCERCGCDIPVSELMFSPMCGYCRHMYEKMLAE
jgi:hypothetical protein